MDLWHSLEVLNEVDLLFETVGQRGSSGYRRRGFHSQRSERNKEEEKSPRYRRAHLSNIH